MKYALFVGQMLIDFLPTPGELHGLPVYQPHPGGAEANAAVALARLGGAARFAGKLSEDNFGRLLLRVLRENGVDTRFVPTTSAGNTALALVTLREQGQRDFTFYCLGTADMLLEARDLNPLAWENVAFCHSGSLLLACEPARSATLAALKQARQSGISTSFDVNVRLALWSSEEEMRAVLAQVVGSVDLLKCSAEEVHYLDETLREPLDSADTPTLRAVGMKLLERGAALVIITRGPLGALLINRQQCVEAPALAVKSLDTTGAGDAFMGAILYQLLTRPNTSAEYLAALDAEALHLLGRFATTAAGLSCTRYGGITSLPSLAEVEQALPDM